MTCIAGVVHEGRIYIGGDSAGSSGSDLRIRRDAKVFANGPLVVGFTSSFRMGQLLRFALTPPPYEPADMDPYRYMVTKFVDAVRDCFKTGGYARKEQEQEEGGTFLVGYRGRLFRISSDYQVGEALDAFDAVGSGAQAALGALYATQGQDPVQRVLVALRAAERVNAGVRGPFTIVSMETHLARLPAAMPAASGGSPDVAAASESDSDRGPGTSSPSAA